MASKSAQISALVAQLKSGEITKAELFEALQRLQHGGAPPPPAQEAPASSARAPPPAAAVVASTRAAPPPAPPAAPVQQQQAPLPSTWPPQQLALQQAMAAAAASQAAAAAAGGGAFLGGGGTATLAQYLGQQQALMAAALSLEAQRHGYTLPPGGAAGAFPTFPFVPAAGSAAGRSMPPPPLPTMGSYGSGSGSSGGALDATRGGGSGGGARQQQYYGDDEQGAQQQHSTSRQGRRDRARAQSVGPGGGRSSASSQGDGWGEAQGDRGGGGSSSGWHSRGSSGGGVPPSGRASRRSVGAGVREQHQQSRQSVGGGGQRGRHTTPLTEVDEDAAAFQERVVAWAEAKRKAASRKAADDIERELAACTFKPTINATSRQVAEASGRTSVKEGEIYERLYHLAPARLRGQTPARGGSPDGGATQGFISPMDPNCTFQPKVNTSFDARPVRARYLDPPPARERRGSESGMGGGFNSSAAPQHLPTGASECTFQPKTNPVRVATMPAAAVYVQAPIYERLNRTHTRAQVERERQVAADLGRLEAAQRERDGGGELDAGEANARSGVPELSEEANRRLTEFLERQAQAEERRATKLAGLKSSTAPVLQPALCDKSLRLFEAREGGSSFLERLARNKVGKEHDLMKSQAMLVRDPECTFAPAINPASKNMQPRSVADLSRGDALKRETATRLMRLKLEQEDLEGVSFKPTINEKSKSVEGRLRILTEPDTYIARIAVEAHSQAEKARRAAAVGDAAELAQCTFSPRVHDAPEYVKRIARSMALTRAVKVPEPASGKPEWR